MRNNIEQTLSFNRSFNRALVTLVVPIALQNLISAAVSSADIIMLGMISQSAMSAISLAGQITFVLTLFYMGLATGAGILAAQYWGKNDTGAIQRVLSIACVFSACVSFLFFVVSLCFPDALMRAFTNDAELIAYGAKYQRAVSFSYLAMSLSQIYLAVVKSMEKARFSAAVSSMALILNIVLNAVSIFVLFPGMPDKAIIGVAAATVSARFAELACCVVHSLKTDSVRFRLPQRDSAQKRLFRDYLRYTMPVQANYIVWGCAMAATTAIIGHVSSDMVAASSVANVVKNLAIVLCGGIASGGSILVGKYLGSGDIQAAKKAGNRLYLYALLFGVLAGATVLLIKPLVFQAVNLNDTARDFLNGMLYICAFYCIGKSLNSTSIGGIFCAGGDSKFGFWCDTVVMWGIILPLGLLCAFVWHVKPLTLYMVLSLDEFVKLPAATVRFCKYRWLNNITRELC